MNPDWKKNYTRYKSYFLNVAARYKEREDIKAYLEILLSLATVSIFATLALRPTLLTIAGLTREIETKQEIIETMDNKIQNIGKAQSLYDRQRNNIALLKTAVPDNPHADVFARQIEGLSNRHQIGITKMSVGKTLILGKQSSQTKTASTVQGKAGKVPFSTSTVLPIEQYPLILGFLGDLTNLRRPTTVNSLTLSAKGNEQKSLVLIIEGSFPYYTSINTTPKQ
jgi:hypothetical protein